MIKFSDGYRFPPKAEHSSRNLLDIVTINEEFDAINLLIAAMYTKTEIDANIYSKTELQISGSASVNYDNIVTHNLNLNAIAEDALLNGTGELLASIGAGTSYDYTQFPRIVKNPVSGVLFSSWLQKATHTASASNVYYIISSDYGKTWTGSNLTDPFTEYALGDWYLNPTPMYTPTGRLILFFQYTGAETGVGRSKATYMYSDDDGLTWSSMLDFEPPIMEDPNNPGTYFTDDTTITGDPDFYSPPYFFNNELMIAENGDILATYWLRASGLNRTTIFIASSSDNGVTWDNNYAMVYSNELSTESEGEATETEWTNCGDGIFVIATRWDGENADGYYASIIMTSKDYGKTWANGTETLALSDIEADSYLSGYVYLEGADTTMGSYLNGVLIDIKCITAQNSKWLLVSAYIRNDGGSLTKVAKLYIANLYDFLELGVDAFLTLGDGLVLYQGPVDPSPPVSRAGGNGNMCIVGDDLIYTCSNQGLTDAEATYIRLNVYSNTISQLITAYNIAKDTLS